MDGISRGKVRFCRTSGEGRGSCAFMRCVVLPLMVRCVNNASWTWWTGYLIFTADV